MSLRYKTETTRRVNYDVSNKIFLQHLQISVDMILKMKSYVCPRRWEGKWMRVNVKINLLWSVVSWMEWTLKWSTRTILPKV